MDTQDTLMIPVEADGLTILVEAVNRDGEQEISGGNLPSFSGIGKAISKVAKELTSAIETVRPAKATLEFGCDFAVEAGQLTALFVNGSGGASVKITMEWDTSK